MLEAARPLLLVGGGKMGEALLAGWLQQGLARDAVVVVEPILPGATRSPARMASVPWHGPTICPMRLLPAPCCWP